MDAYLSKPLDRDQLRACLQRVLEQRRDQQLPRTLCPNGAETDG
jgi:YesN/AraC family two-component response regulator